MKPTHPGLVLFCRVSVFSWLYSFFICFYLFLFVFIIKPIIKTLHFQFLNTHIRANLSLTQKDTIFACLQFLFKTKRKVETAQQNKNTEKHFKHTTQLINNFRIHILFMGLQKNM